MIRAKAYPAARLARAPEGFLHAPIELRGAPDTHYTLQVYEEELTKNTAERNKLRAEFDADITRFKELKGVK